MVSFKCLQLADDEDDDDENDAVDIDEDDDDELDEEDDEDDDDEGDDDEEDGEVGLEYLQKSNIEVSLPSCLIKITYYLFGYQFHKCSRLEMANLCLYTN